MPMRRLLLNTFAAILLLAGVSAAEEDAPRFGTWVTNRDATLYARPSADSRIVRRLRPRTVIEVGSITDQWLEVRSVKGNPNGFIRRSYAEPFTGRKRARPAFRPGIFRLVDPVIVRSEPDLDSRRVMTLAAGTTVRVVGRSGNWYRVESESGDRPPGYIPTISAKRVE